MARLHHLRDKLHILIIGGNGFIGRHFIHQMINQPNIRMWSVDKREHEVPLMYKDTPAIVDQTKADLATPGRAADVIDGFDYDFIIYCAGYEAPTDGLHPKFSHEAEALKALSNTLEAMRAKYINEANVEDRPYFMYLSSHSVYGFNRKKVSKENATLLPANYSGMMKLAAEDLVGRMMPKLGIPYSILRPTEVFGRHHHKELSNQGFWPGYLCYFMDQAIRRQEQLDVFCPKTKVDLIHVNYLTRVMVEIMAGRKEGIYNVSSGDPLTLKELAEKIIENYGDGCVTKVKPSSRLRIEDMTIDNSKVASILPYDNDKYCLDTFIKEYIPVRKYEIARDMTIEQILNQHYLLDATAPGAMAEYRKRQKERLLNTIKIKEVAGDQFEKISYGRFQERARELITGTENRLLIKDELDRIEEHENFRKEALSKSYIDLKDFETLPEGETSNELEPVEKSNN